jgi:hypothetical protein
VGYTSRSGRRPDEHASRASHQYIIQDEAVQEFLHNCELPKPPDDLDKSKLQIVQAAPPSVNPIQHIISIDGGYTEVVLRKEFPSSTMAFFQFGALIFGMNDLEQLADSRFIFPEQISQLKKIQRFKLALPTRAVLLKNTHTLTESVRRSVYSFFVRNTADHPLIETLRWFLFEEYADKPLQTWSLASCPQGCGARNVDLRRDKLKSDYTFVCPTCGGTIWLTDAFRLHEAVDDEQGASGILGYLVTLVEQCILVHMIHIILRTKALLLKEILFVKDGPLGFFGQTANMHKPMRQLVRFLLSRHDLYLVGSEKSGPFVEHAAAVAPLLDSGTALLLDNEYIHRYIIPGKADPDRPYGITTYYGDKLIYKTASGSMYVLTIPTTEHRAAPRLGDLPHLDVILHNVAKLRCDMYDNSLVPVALVNKLVSLSDHPSSKILERFAKEGIAS